MGWTRKIMLTGCLALGIGAMVYNGRQLMEIDEQEDIMAHEMQLFNAHVKDPRKDASQLSFEASLPEEESVFSRAQDAPLEIDWEGLRSVNPDIVGWIEVENTPLSFPVVQGQDDEWYLNHTWQGQESIYGAVFLSASSSSDLSDDNTIIYAHSTDTGSMFTPLAEFKDAGYFNEHTRLFYYTPEKTYAATIYAFLQTTHENPVYKILFGDEKETILSGILNSATYKRPVDFTRAGLITLSTCDLDYGYASSQRLVLSACFEREPEKKAGQKIELEIDL